MIEKLNTEPDFIWSKKNENSLKSFMEQHSEGVPDKTICKVLKITPEELQNKFEAILAKLKIQMEKV